MSGGRDIIFVGDTDTNEIERHLNESKVHLNKSRAIDFAKNIVNFYCSRIDMVLITVVILT